MGFFSSIFARKTNANRASIKGQAYNSTVASAPPIQGTYPVAGNGPNVLDQLQRAARKRSQAQLSMVSSHDANLDPSAPPPLVPRFRELSPSRPTTAPNHISSLASRPRSLSRSIRSSNSAWSVPERPARGRIEKPPPVPSIPTHHRRESSIESKRTSFIDVLDAQGELKPSNFRSRVAASGAREYGEDVAERNVGENGLNLNSAAVKAFYRLSGSGRLTLQANEDRPYELEEEEEDDDDDDDDDDAAPFPGVPHGDLGTIREAWSRPTSSSAWRSFSTPMSNDTRRSSKSNLRIDKRPDTSQAALVPGTASMQDRRRSFNAFASPPAQETERQKPRPLSLHPSLSNFSYDASLSPPPPVQRSRPKTTEGRSRRRSVGRAEIDNVVDEAFDEPAPCPAVPPRFKQPEQRSSTYLEPNYNRHDNRHETHYTRPESYHGASPFSSYPRSEVSQPSRPSSSSSIDRSFSRSRSMASSALRNQRLDDINEHIPVRMSSLTLQSQPCVTPTTMSSGFSSNQHPRSAGQHTPSTSIDASLPPSIKMRPEHEQCNTGNQTNYDNAGDDDFSAETLVPSRIEMERDLGHPTNAGLELDLYVSDASEDSIDSFVAWKEKRRDEEGLLLRDNYGMTGDGLPGLFEPLPILKAPSSPPPIPQIPCEPTVSKRPKTPKSPRRPQTRSNKSTPRRSRQHQSHARANTPRRTRRGSLSGQEDADSFWENDIPPGPGFVSLAELGIDLRQLGLDQYGLTEEDDAKVDIQTAIKLRKAMKHKERQQREDEEGCAADTED
ncbi:hypothetical protein F66182_8607 [Fusarium sp. NRRL 66182]|nr:hypothetical protein F66182_8607 [Fusarium sp. NRRL 66182]